MTREYPNVLQHVLGGPQDARTPRELHPIFYGSYDWHSCVHGHWLLAALLRLQPDVAQAETPDEEPVADAERPRARVSG